MPHDWADTIGGLGELELDRFGFDKDPARLVAARGYIEEARSVLSQGDDYLTDHCTTLLSQIEAAEATL